MQSLTRTATVDGTEARLVTIECTTTSGFAGMQMVGNISDLCRDGKERAKTVLESQGFRMGHKRILINFSPADCRKDGNHFDLPIAISLAALTGERKLRIDPKDWLFAAELGLDGSLRPAKGIVPLILTAIEQGLKGVVIAAENAEEMMVLEQVAKVHGTGFQYLCFQTLREVLIWLVEGERERPPEVNYRGYPREVGLPEVDRGNFPGVVGRPEANRGNFPGVAGRPEANRGNFPGEAEPSETNRGPYPGEVRPSGTKHGPYPGEVRPQDLDHRHCSGDVSSLTNFDDMYLDDNLRRLALCFATGRHSLLLRGTPGCGKSMFAQRLPSLLPLLRGPIHLDALRIHSLMHKRISTEILRGRAPFRQPHHTTNPQALLGSADEPGEMSLAHGGVLFLDELPEFRRDLLEALREPLETGHLNISRAQKKFVWKSKVQLVAACNNCPCGFTGSKRMNCKCATQKIMAYESKMSGPLLERIDMHYKMPEMNPSQFSQSIPKQSAQMLRDVERARNYMYERWGRELDNAEASFEEILQSSEIIGLKREDLMKHLERLKVSSRSTLRLLRVARTLADIDQSLKLEDKHIDQAAKLRP